MVFELLETLHRGGFGAIDAVKLDAATTTLVLLSSMQDRLDERYLLA